jgi:beta-glucosidase
LAVGRRALVRRGWPKHIACQCLAALALGASPAQPAAPGAAHAERWPLAHSPGLVDPVTEQQVTQLLAGLTLEEKVGQMIQADVASITPDDLRRYPLGAILAGGNSPALGAGRLRSGQAQWVATAQAFRRVALEARPGHTPIPPLFGIDAVHGNSHVAGATVFPHNVGLGAAHDPDLLQRIGEATAQETAASGFDWDFGPTVAVPQDVRWGRSYEGYAQDPQLVRRYAEAQVRGLQGAPGLDGLVQRGHVAASAKHFLGDGGTAGGIDQGDARASEDELIRLHAQGYVGAIDAGVLTVMTSFSSWQGVKMTANRSLLTEVLKGRLGFDGFVVSDWNSHGQVPGCSNQSCAAAINAGVDMLMAPDSWRELFVHTLEQARDGRIAVQRIDDAVRRILRVKLHAGLFDPARPWEGRAGVLGSPEHLQLAREAVRKSLVLLKNNGGVLPLRGRARVLVAGSGADSIGMQCGGWTLSWQGNDNRNSDFPQGQSIYAGLREAIEAGGGSVELARDGDGNGGAADQARPDVAVVVFGEQPYAEGWGDLKSLAYAPGDGGEPTASADLQWLRRLKARGLPVVAVFLSGRPLWLNPQLNAADAFVAAWLPGSQGAGVADVLVGDAAGQPRHDFSGRLPFAWPASADPARGLAPPLFAAGYGLRYGDQRRLGLLSERSGVRASDANFAHYFVHGRAAAPWSLFLRQDPQAVATPVQGASTVAGHLGVRAVDADGLQEGGREFTWDGAARATALLSGPPLDMRMLSNGDAALILRLRVDEAPAGPVELRLGCGRDCGARLDVTALLAESTPGAWRSIKIKLACFRDAGADVGHVDQPFAVSTADRLRLTLADVELSSDPAGAVCPPRGPAPEPLGAR